jgi:hypothetical protein
MNVNMLKKIVSAAGGAPIKIILNNVELETALDRRVAIAPV